MNNGGKISLVFFMFFLMLGQASAVGNAGEGQKLAAQCVGCHGPNGEGVAPKTKIAGLNAGVFSKAMQAYKSGERKHPVMEQLTKTLSDKDVDNLAAYYASK